METVQPTETLYTAYIPLHSYSEYLTIVLYVINTIVMLWDVTMGCRLDYVMSLFHITLVVSNPSVGMSEKGYSNKEDCHEERGIPIQAIQCISPIVHLPSGKLT